MTVTESKTLQSFGARGDGASDDTAAVRAAIAHMARTGQNVRVPQGTYLTDPFVIDIQPHDLQAMFVGDDRERCILQRRAAGAAPFMTVGASAAKSFKSGQGCSQLTINGGPPSNGDAYVAYDLVRSTFSDVLFTGGAVACHLYGGISLSFNDCRFGWSGVGLKCETFASQAGGGVPNLIRINGGEAVNNATWGIWFNHGNSLYLDGVDVEGNGTTLGATEGGIYVGPDVGLHLAPTDAVTLGLVARNCWFEANNGLADVSIHGGINSVSDSSFFSTQEQARHDVYAAGGRYNLHNVNMSFPKGSNVHETANVMRGNSISSSDIPTMHIDASKTMVSRHAGVSARGGDMVIATGVANPALQSGRAATQFNTLVQVPFDRPFSGVPVVFVATENGDTSTQLLQVVVSMVSSIGFWVRGIAVIDGAPGVSQISMGFNWVAIGPLT